MNIYQPYTYLIHHIPTNTYYYGVRFAKGCNPKDLWVKYFTSSKVVKSLIKQYGKESFRYEIRKTFTDPKAALIWEHKVINRMNAVKDDRWLNRNVGTMWCGRLAGFKHKEFTKQKLSEAHTGKKLSPEHIHKLSVAKLGKPSPRKGSKASEETKARMAEKKVKAWLIVTPEHLEITIINLKQFCDENDLNAASLQKVAYGQRKHHKGYTCRML